MNDEMYASLRESFPELFVNPPGAGYEILLDPELRAAAEKFYAGQLAGYGFPAELAQTGVVYYDPWVMLLRDAVRGPSGEFGTYIRAVPFGNAEGVVILPVHDGRVVLVRHFRHATRDWQWELPRGFGLPGSEPADDARRELLEEIGAEATALHELGAIYPDTGLTSGVTRLFLAEIAGEPRPATAEGITEVRHVSPAELGELIRDETIKDSFTINAYARAVLRGHLEAKA
ncbi:ADP-ribose pyrophosphatase [Actinoplanes tereljensis]|nr:NUDIX hydrolase [Actinoplanes tereljensis]